LTALALVMSARDADGREELERGQVDDHALLGRPGELDQLRGDRVGPLDIEPARDFDAPQLVADVDVADGHVVLPPETGV
jgi:hypothetical protein